MENVEVTHKEERDDIGAKLGMWIFIFTELFLFGGLFIVYSVYRFQYHDQFHEAALELNAFIGAVNTVVLLISSMTVAMSITALRQDNKKLSMRLVMITLICALIFLVNKYFEWSVKFEHRLYPGSDFMMTLDHGYVLFFGLYFFMTGLHALHIIVGSILLTITYIKIGNGSVQKEKFVLLENSALYWHLVDMIWIFLFPLLYLIT